jgi:hypothetical protein
MPSRLAASPRPALADAGRWGPFQRKGWRRLGRPSGSNLTLGTRSGGRLGVETSHPPRVSVWLRRTVKSLSWAARKVGAFGINEERSINHT